MLDFAETSPLNKLMYKFKIYVWSRFIITFFWKKKIGKCIKLEQKECLQALCRSLSDFYDMAS